ncbi:MAG: hypothetical protein DMG97_43310 [Acidobacteria bacterium]|nr:MAG: hypothetical protein DMG97_43310 [Acidobacteriota bacterium]
MDIEWRPNGIKDRESNPDWLNAQSWSRSYVRFTSVPISGETIKYDAPLMLQVKVADWPEAMEFGVPRGLQRSSKTLAVIILVVRICSTSREGP